MAGRKVSVKRSYLHFFPIVFLLVAILIVVSTSHNRSLASAQASVWGSRPLLEHYLMNATLTKDLENEVGLTEIQIRSVNAITLQEAQLLQELERESQQIISDPSLDIQQKRVQITKMGYNRRMSQILAETQASLQDALGENSYQRLVRWIESRWLIERQVGKGSLSSSILGSWNNVSDLKSYPRSFKVYATRYDAGGRYIVALPDKCLKFANGGALLCNDGYQYGQSYSVAITYKGKTVYALVGESGPWNIDDNYWANTVDPQPRRLFTDLPLGVPEAQAAYFNGYNGGVDQFGRVVTSPVAIDISYAVAKDLGLPSGNNQVTVSFLWTEGWDAAQSPPAESTPAPTAIPIIPIVTSTPNSDGSLYHVVQQGQTLIGIAKAYDVSLQDLLVLNGLTLDSVILPGDKIMINEPLSISTSTPLDTPEGTKNFPKAFITATGLATSTPHKQVTESTQPAGGDEMPTSSISENAPDSEGLSSRELILIFIVGVALFGVILIATSLLLNRKP